jgi:hypothetical protein
MNATRCIGLGLLVTAMAFAGANSYRVKFHQDLRIAGTVFTAGEYKGEMRGDMAAFDSGKGLVEGPAPLQPANKTFRYTAVHTSDKDVSEIDIGDTTSRLVFGSSDETNKSRFTLARGRYRYRTTLAPPPAFGCAVGPWKVVFTQKYCPRTNDERAASGAVRLLAALCVSTKAKNAIVPVAGDLVDQCGALSENRQKRAKKTMACCMTPVNASRPSGKNDFTDLARHRREGHPRYV